MLSIEAFVNITLDLKTLHIDVWRKSLAKMAFSVLKSHILCYQYPLYVESRNKVCSEWCFPKWCYWKKL